MASSDAKFPLPTSETESPPQASVKRARKVYMACSWCRKQKLKCDGRQPCHRCQSSSRAEGCHYDDEEESHPAHRMATPYVFTDVVNRLDRLEGSIDRILHMAQTFWGHSPHRPADRLENIPRIDPEARLPFDNEQVNGESRQHAGLLNLKPSAIRPRLPATSAHNSSSLGKRVAGIESMKEWNNNNLSNATFRGPHGPFSAFVQCATSPPGDHAGGIVVGSQSMEPMDPISVGLLTHEQANSLFRHFIENVYPYIPIFELEEANLDHAKKVSSFLLTAILAISARFFSRFSALFDNLSDLVDLHVSRSLLGTKHEIYDVQACLLLSAYGLRKNGIGLDPWILSGHTIRLCSRLKLLDTTALEENHPDYNKEKCKQLTMLLVFILDTCLSYGFGRPLTRWPLDLPFLETGPLLHSRHRQSRDVFLAAFSILVKIPLSVMSFFQSSAEAMHADFAYRERLLQEMTMAHDYLLAWEEQWLMSSISRELIPQHLYTLNLIRDHIFITLDSLAKDVSSLHTGDDESANTGYQLFETFGALAVSNAIGLSRSICSEPDDSFVSYAPDYSTICNAQAALYLIRVADSLRTKPWQHDIPERRQDLWRKADGLVKGLSRLDKSICQMGSYMSRRVEAIMSSRDRVAALAVASRGGQSRSMRPVTATHMDQHYVPAMNTYPSQTVHPPPSLSTGQSFSNSPLFQDSHAYQMNYGMTPNLDNLAWDSAIFGQLWDPSLMPFMSLLDKPTMGLVEQ